MSEAIPVEVRDGKAFIDGRQAEIKVEYLAKNGCSRCFGRGFIGWRGEAQKKADALGLRIGCGCVRPYACAVFEDGSFLPLRQAAPKLEPSPTVEKAMEDEDPNPGT